MQHIWWLQPVASCSLSEQTVWWNCSNTSSKVVDSSCWCVVCLQWFSKRLHSSSRRSSGTAPHWLISRTPTRSLRLEMVTWWQIPSKRWQWQPAEHLARWSWNFLYVGHTGLYIQSAPGCRQGKLCSIVVGLSVYLSMDWLIDGACSICVCDSNDGKSQKVQFCDYPSGM